MARYGYSEYKGSQNYGEDFDNLGYRPPVRTYTALSSLDAVDNPLDKGDTSDRSMLKGMRPSAEIEVDMPAEVALNDPQLLDRYDGGFAEQVSNRVGDTLSDAEFDSIIRQQSETPQMVVSRPGKIRAAFSDPRMRHSTGKLFGMIADDLRGQRVIADADLSRHSSKLVNKALEAGVVEPNPVNPSGGVTNKYDFSETLSYDNLQNERSPQEVDRATKELMHRIGKRGASLSSQFSTQGEWGPRVPDSKQLKLF
jgi:hypothetical protein